ncbi:MAG: hypothetical protein Q9170_006768 [Blastenia crenularia]
MVTSTKHASKKYIKRGCGVLHRMSYYEEFPSSLSDVYLKMASRRATSLVAAKSSRGIRYSRCYSSVAEPDLKTTLKDVIPAKRELLKRVKSHASKTIGEVKIENTLGGMRQGSSFD